MCAVMNILSALHRFSSPYSYNAGFWEASHLSTFTSRSITANIPRKNPRVAGTCFSHKLKNRGWDSSVGRQFDWKSRHNTDVGSSPWCGKEFFSRANFQCRLCYSVCRALRAIARITMHTRAKNPKHWQPHHYLDTQKYYTLVGMGGAALAAVVPYPGKATWRSTNKKLQKHQWAGWLNKTFKICNGACSQTTRYLLWSKEVH